MSAIQQVIAAYDPLRPLPEAATIPSAWYRDPRVLELERRSVFGGNWLLVGPLDWVRESGQFLTADVAGEPVVVVRGSDGTLRGFFNVCRHHAAAVMTAECGKASVLRCPYHGWAYALDGKLKGAPEFEGVCNFEVHENGLVPLRVESWENMVFVNLSAGWSGLAAALGDLPQRVRPLGIERLRHFERRTYDIGCNWKVFVDNYLDGGYHVPHIHHGLGSVLNYSSYTIENSERYCLQSSPIRHDQAEAETAAVRGGDRAYYYWSYPNYMLNLYEGVMDTNLVWPLGVDRCRVVFDFYFADVSPQAAEFCRNSINVANQVQLEDIGVCESVQRGLGSRSYDVGRLSVRREAGEHLFHRLLFADLDAAVRSATERSC